MQADTYTYGQSQSPLLAEERSSGKAYERLLWRKWSLFSMLPTWKPWFDC
jgi:hypothetical protein